MQYRKLPHGNEEISILGIGTSSIGMAGQSEIEKTAALALESGINYFDMASSDAHPFEAFGRAAAGRRKNVYFQIHFGADYQSGKYGWTTNLDTIKRSVDWQLQNLKTDYIDVYLVHCPDPNVPMEETMDALNTLKKQGKILHIGVSNFTKEQMEEAEKYCAIEAYQPQYSMVDRKWEQLIRWACAQKMGVMTYGTLGGGILTGKYRELKEYGVDDNRNRFYPYFKEPLFSKVMLLLRTMDQISVERNVPLSQIALNWTLQRPFISSCIIGAQSRDKIEENCKVFEWKLSDDEMQLLEQALKKTII